MPLVRRGALGIEALCNWLETCINHLGIDAVLLEGKLENLLGAINLL